MSLTTVERKYYESLRGRARWVISRRKAAYETEIALHQKTIDECNAKLVENEIAENNHHAAKSDISDLAERDIPLPKLTRKDRL